MRKFRVDISTTIEIEVDDTVISDWDGKGVLDPTSERWNHVAIATEEDVIGALGLALLNDYRVGGSDGFADLPENTATANWPNQSIDHVEEVL
jgi:hypothetical protein